MLSAMAIYTTTRAVLSLFARTIDADAAAGGLFPGDDERSRSNQTKSGHTFLAGLLASTVVNNTTLESYILLNTLLSPLIPAARSKSLLAAMLGP